MDAITLQTLYISTQAPNGRDTLPALAHFATPIAADGEIFIGTQNSLEVYGLLSGQAMLGRQGEFAKIASSPRPSLHHHEPQR